MEIIKLEGEDKRLYSMVAHLVMSETALSYNLEYPFRTSSEYRWFIATEKGKTLGFIPVKMDEDKAIINNYYIVKDDSAVFLALLKEVVQTLRFGANIEAIAQVRHVPTFEQCGFALVLYWKRYAKMIIYGGSVTNAEKKMLAEK